LSEEVERLRAENEALSHKCNELESELATVKAERDDYAASKKALTPEIRDRILTALGVGKQSPQYKRLKVLLDQLMP
jgi:chromosome segregation ATPase